jgi:hypothetical protein
MGKRERLPSFRVYASPEARWVKTNRQSLSLSLSEMSKSDTLLTLLDGTRLRLACLGLTQPSPLFSSAFLPKVRLLSKSTPGVRHYVARGVEASNHGADSARQANDGGHRRPCVFTKERGRGFQARHTGTTTEARKEQNPPKKFKLGHYQR